MIQRPVATLRECRQRRDERAILEHLGQLLLAFDGFLAEPEDVPSEPTALRDPPDALLSGVGDLPAESFMLGRSSPSRSTATSL